MTTIETEWAAVAGGGMRLFGRCRYILVLVALFGLLSGAKGQITFAGAPTIDFSSGFLTSGTSLTLNSYAGAGIPSHDGTKLELTDGGYGESRSAFYATKVDIAKTKQIVSGVNSYADC